MVSQKSWILYGANGYTGALIAEEAKKRGLQPILAGRRREAIEGLAERLGFECRVFALESPEAARRGLAGAEAVLLAAGPFSATSRPVVDACIELGMHYLDITGEITVFESCFRRGHEAASRGCTLLPGVGFDVVPSDCLAASLKLALPQAANLELAFHSGSTPSKGTAKTMLEGFSRGGVVRELGRLRRVPLAWKTAEIPFRDRRRHTVTVPWGDLSTAFHSTGIPEIVIYTSLSRKLSRRLRLLRPLAPLVGLRPVQSFLKRLIERRVQGPDAEARQVGRCQLWGKAASSAGDWVEGTLQTPEAYRLTSLTAVACIERVLAGGVPHGFVTPAMAFGAGFISEIEGCDLRVGDVHCVETG